MGKGTDKLYITHSEWASGDAFAANNLSSSKAPGGATFRRLPYNFCAVSLQPFSHPVCTVDGTIFDITHILPWLKKHGTNPVDGKPLKASELIKLNFTKNEEEEYVDPVTFKPFTDNTHIVALRKSGNVFAWDTIERLNIKAKNWNDLVSDEAFTRKDIITLQDPQNLAGRDLSTFKYIKDGTSTLTAEQEQERADPTANLNLAAMGSSAKILKAKEALAKSRADRALTKTSGSASALAARTSSAQGAMQPPPKSKPQNAALHTTGQAAASFTSTGLTPFTSNANALLSDEDYMLKPRRVRQKGYARMHTSQGSLNIELHTEHAPRAVWNFVKLAQSGYYRDVKFHRNIRNFMIQGGDPTGTGRGGQSIWGKPFVDEWATSPLKHDARGILSMANKGKNTNTSQFFVLYRQAPHLDRKHTIFGKVVDAGDDGESLATLSRLEAVPTESGDRPTEECFIEDVVIYVDPFEEFLKEKAAKENETKAGATEKTQGGNDDDTTTWTGKRIRKDGTVDNGESGASVGKYLTAAKNKPPPAEDEIVEFVEHEIVEEPPPKRRKGGGGFGNFDGW